MLGRQPLEEPVPLSESVIWQLMREYFQRERVRAWSAGVVPDMITTNAVVASTYARVLVAFLREWRASVDSPPSEPVDVIELGAGSGRFAHHLLQKLTPRLRASSTLDGVGVRHVMTDLPGGSVDQWRRHPFLRSHAAAGRLDFGTLDGTRPGPVQLTETGAVLGPGRSSAPLVVIANYVFDSLPIDAFLVEGGRVSEYLAATHAPAGGVGRSAHMGDLALAWTQRPLGPGRRYTDAELDGLLRSVTAGGEDRTILFPTFGVDLLRTLRSFTSGPMLVLTADKGFCRGPIPVLERGPYMATHGSVSFSVDYTVLAAWVRARHGLALLPDHGTASLAVASFILDDDRRAWPATSETFRDVADHGGPDDFFTLENLRSADANVASLLELLTRLRTSEWDPSVFRRLFPALMIRAISTDRGDRIDLLDAAARVEGLYFPIGEPVDIPFALAMLRWRAGDPPGGRRLLQWSENLHGPDPDRTFGVALCHLAEGNDRAALDTAGAALALDPRHPFASELWHWLSDGSGVSAEGAARFCGTLMVGEKVPGHSAFQRVVPGA